MASEKIEAQSVIRCDLPYYDTTITRDFVARMNCFARDLGILNTDVPFERIVALPHGNGIARSTAVSPNLFDSYRLPHGGLPC